MRHFGRNARGEPLYTSEELLRYWSVDGRPMGHVTLGEVTFDSAVYCAKYALKKISLSEHSSAEARAEFDARYVVHDLDGEILSVPLSSLLCRVVRYWCRLL